ncbi:MAG: peptidase S24/S26A/S26B/S26C [Olpidium bornovanus]|uniref:Mitochondrial inner membrane protease subunit 2 n=1 Tax=Olpidium bornovanus TaxID=278681 RepID=A0A8H7ZN46_9FUNG|nr:MAG: peptidase S24/S26A/S26B/S26C [Olpidium bornovanus]
MRSHLPSSLARARTHPGASRELPFLGTGPPARGKEINSMLTARRLFRLLPWVPVAVFVVDHGVSVAFVEGRSMQQPTLNPDSNLLKSDLVLLTRWASRTHDYEVGDVVILNSPIEPGRQITKRIIALEGDCVRPLNTSPDAGKVVRIRKGHAWVEGDGPSHSVDSNHFGPVPLGLIHSKVKFILWPFSRIGPILVPNDGRVREYL